jgi:predicted acetyltransferase
MMRNMIPDVQLRLPRLDEEGEFLRAHRATTPTSPTFLHFYEEGLPFPRYVERLADIARGINVPNGFVPTTFLFAFLGDRIVGRVSIRHELNTFLAREGGHIGYTVVPEFRRRGCATRMLAMALGVLHKTTGARRALVTTNDDNIASQRVIEKNGGILQDVISGPDLEKPLRRYWIEMR